MQKTIAILHVFLFLCKIAGAQNKGFEMGKILISELTMPSYHKDSNAVAVVLNEFGNAFIDTDKTYDLIVEYQVKIKILKQSGVSRGDIIIPLRKTDKNFDKINWVRASSYNLEDGRIVESKLESKNVFIENAGKQFDLKKFSIPNVKAGTVIEYKYQLQTPFIFNFSPWEFQSDIPKVRSEYWAMFPANYVYNIALIGSLKLSKNEAEVIKKCVVVSDTGHGQGTFADCTLLKFGMDDIPAFIEEEYMTAKSNFLSKIDFELNEVRHFSGKVDRISKTWEDVEDELRSHKDFGLQLKRGKNVLQGILQKNPTPMSDSLTLAKEIYAHLQNWYQWNGTYGIFTEVGIKGSYDNKKGSVADINLALVTCLRLAGFKADPLILSTRKNGIPKDIFPVISDFNYVIARMELQGRTFLLDATDDFFPFGSIPTMCLNGKGRVITEKKSFWQELTPVDRFRSVELQHFVLSKAGSISGSINNLLYGYEAITHRKNRAEFQTASEYLQHLSNEEYPLATISELTESNLENINLTPAEKFSVEMSVDEISNKSPFYLDPFFATKKLDNPFISPERLYPVDFGAPIDKTISVIFELPDNLEISSLPPPVALSLPNNGGRYQFEVQSKDRIITVNSRLYLAKSIYSNEEYYFLRELFTRMIQIKDIPIVLSLKEE